ncbi:hypothetical protein ACFX1Q_010891 [Malus domestica]
MTSSVWKPERQATPEEQARRGLPAREPEGCVRRVRFTRAWARVVRQKNRPGARDFSFEKLPLGKPRGFPMSV